MSSFPWLVLPPPLLSHFSHLLTAMPEHSWAKSVLRWLPKAAWMGTHLATRGKSATSQHFPVSLSLLLDLVSHRQEGDRQPSASLMGQPIAVASGSGNSLKWCQGLLDFQLHVSVPFSLLSNLLWIESRLPGVHTTCLPKWHKGTLISLFPVEEVSTQIGRGNRENVLVWRFCDFRWVLMRGKYSLSH